MADNREFVVNHQPLHLAEAQLEGLGQGSQAALQAAWVCAADACNSVDATGQERYAEIAAMGLAHTASKSLHGASLLLTAPAVLWL